MYGAPRFATPWSSQPLLFLASVHSLLILLLVTRALYSAIGSSICQSIRSRARRDSDASPETTKPLCQIYYSISNCVFLPPPFFLIFSNVRPNFNNSSAHVGRVGPSGYFEAEVERERERETGANSAAIEPQFSRSDSCFPCTRDIYSPHRAEVACILCWEGKRRRSRGFPST